MDISAIAPVTDRDIKIMNVLRNMVEDVPPVRSARLIAAVAHRGNILSFGSNSMRSHPFQQRFGRNSDAMFWHAETNAIYNFLRHHNSDDLSKTSLYVMRIKRPSESSKNWVLGMSRPCKGCQKCIMDFGIPRVIYTTDNQTFVCE
jgi:deoxycytidylate deaminase